MSKKSATHIKLPRVPPDHILINERWRDRELGRELTQTKFGGIYSDQIGIIDFLPADGLCVIYFSSNDYTAFDYKKRLKSFFEVCRSKGVVIAERNTQTVANYSAVQDFATFSLNLFVFPVAGPPEIPDILKDLGFIKCSSPNNPFQVRNDDSDLASKQLTMLMTIPNVGRKKAQTLITKFDSIKNISAASLEELTKVVESACAKHVYNFFHEKYTIPDVKK